jgi:predicted unusual protein kinase regulating ubiquinone biosynthesis (AarF/ABC1/UbiB family)
LTDARADRATLGNQPEPSIGLSTADRVGRAARTGSAIAKVYLGYKSLELLDRSGLRGLARSARQRWHRESARTLHDTSLELGGLFLKVGQYLSTRTDVLPPAYGEQLVRLQDRVPPHPYRVVRDVIEDELGAPPQEIFEHFWRRPVASASLAQVHRAVLHDGRHVAVKIQRPGISTLVEADLTNLRAALDAIERLEGRLGFGAVLDEVAESLPRELDFRLEAENARRIADGFANDPAVVIPGVIDELVTRRVLVTEYISGFKVTDVRRLRRARIDPKAVAQALLSAYAEQILQHGFFHADPHPGNLIVVPSEPFALAFVDFGQAQQVPESFRTHVGALAAGLLGGSTDTTEQALRDLGISATADSETLAKIAALLGEFVTRKRSAAKAVGRTPQQIGEEFTDLLREDREVQLPPYLWGLARVLGLLFGVSNSLGVKLDLVGSLLPHLARREQR